MGVAYPLRLIVGTSTLLMIGVARHDLPSWLGAVGVALFLVFVVVVVRAVLVR